MKKLLSCCPVVNKEVINLIPVDFQFQPGKPLSAFEASIYWLQESEATVCLTSTNKPTQYFAKYDDREGYLSSLDQAYRLGKQIATTYDFNTYPNDTVQIKIDLFQTPVFELFSQKIKFSWGKDTNWRQYETVADNWVEIEHPDKPISSKNVLRPIKRRILLHQHSVFNSDTPGSICLSAVDSFKKEWSATPTEQPMYSKSRK
jgi:hypothetical protein